MSKYHPNSNSNSSGKNSINSSITFPNTNSCISQDVSGEPQRQRQRSRSTDFSGNHFGNIFVRTVVTMDPDSDLFMKVAQRAYQEHEKSLVPCSKCGRTFFPDRIEAHQNSCAASRLSTNMTKSLMKQKSNVLDKRTSKIKTAAPTPNYSSVLSKDRPKQLTTNHTAMAMGKSSLDCDRVGRSRRASTPADTFLNSISTAKKIVSSRTGRVYQHQPSL